MPNNELATLPNLVSIPRGYAQLNPVGMELANLAAWHLERLGHMGLLASSPDAASMQPLGVASNPAATQRRVWLEEPPGSIPFDEQANYAITGVVSPPAVVLRMRVPKGFDGVIKWLSNNIIGAPFIPGSYVWSLQINHRPVRNFGTITQEKGTVTQGREISPIRVFAGDLVTFDFREEVAGGTGSTSVSLTGYYYPSKGIS